MRKVIYSMAVSLDGYIAGPDGDFSWSAPGPELHRFHNEQMRDIGVHLLGRGLYETMVYWETAAANPETSEVEREFAEIWMGLDKIVFSDTLESVDGDMRLADENVERAVRRLRDEPGKDIAVGGAGLAACCARLGLIDEYRVLVSPVMVGGGTSFFPQLESPIELELVETRSFDEPGVYLRYRRT